MSKTLPVLFLFVLMACQKAENHVPLEPDISPLIQLGCYRIEPDILPPTPNCRWISPNGILSDFELDSVRGDTALHFAHAWFNLGLTDTMNKLNYYYGVDDNASLSNLIYCPSDKHRSWVLVVKEGRPWKFQAGWTLNCDPKTDDYYLLPCTQESN